jgi:hypothetical protein
LIDLIAADLEVQERAWLTQNAYSDVHVKTTVEEKVKE